MDEFEAVMAAPVKARDAQDVLYPLMGDDDLFDSLADAKAADPGADVRGIVAGTLELWLHWTVPAEWNQAIYPDEWERLGRVFDSVRGLSDGGIAEAVRVVRDDEGARTAVAWATDVPEGEEGSIELAPGFVSGVWAARKEDGSVYRVDGYDGTVMKASEAAAQAVAERFGSARPQPAAGP